MFVNKILSTRLGLALAALAALPLLSQAQVPSANPAQESTADDQLTVVRDAETGQLRAPNAAELAALRARAANRLMTRAAPQVPLPKVHASGARGARVTDELMNHSVLMRNPDGSLSKQCFESKEAADLALKSPAFATRPSLAAKLETE